MGGTPSASWGKRTKTSIIVFTKFIVEKAKHVFHIVTAITDFVVLGFQMPERASITFHAEPLFLVLAKGELLLDVSVQIRALITFLTLALFPVNAYNLVYS